MRPGGGNLKGNNHLPSHRRSGQPFTKYKIFSFHSESQDLITATQQSKFWLNYHHRIHNTFPQTSIMMLRWWWWQFVLFKQNLLLKVNFFQNLDIGSPVGWWRGGRRSITKLLDISRSRRSKLRKLKVEKAQSWGKTLLLFALHCLKQYILINSLFSIFSGDHLQS